MTDLISRVLARINSILGSTIELLEKLPHGSMHEGTRRCSFCRSSIVLRDTALIRATVEQLIVQLVVPEPGSSVLCELELWAQLEGRGGMEGSAGRV